MTLYTLRVFYKVYHYVYVHAMVDVCRSEDNFLESALFLYLYVGPGDSYTEPSH